MHFPWATADQQQLEGRSAFAAFVECVQPGKGPALTTAAVAAALLIASGQRNRKLACEHCQIPKGGARSRRHPRHTQSPSGTVTEVQSGAQLRDWDCSPSLKGGTARDCELSANRFKRTVRDCGRSTLRVQGTGTEHRGRKQDCRALRDCKHNPV